ncbi:MFS transporter [Loigolactobacillus iwatensis]|uniref:MFS transporter n=1 Tax=Loigolactobacillus iwatensis TaxID=1267156 RepID=UPI000F7DA75C|nr:MFS transporter [Loigolactobacillus iwatensis]
MINQSIKEQKPSWRQNLTFLWFGNFMTGMGFSMTMPFLPLFIQTLGNFNKWQLNLYSGTAFAITFLVKAIVSPFWGKLADEHGRKMMCLRAALGMTFTITACGFVPNITVLIILRALQGGFSGYINNANAIIAAAVPREKSGQAMGTLATGNVVGTLLGPLLGGVLAGIAGYRSTFYVTGALMFIVFLMTLFFVHEKFSPLAKGDLTPTRQVFRELRYPKLITGMFITTLIIQAANMSVTPIVSLFVGELLHHHGPIALISGVVAALPGVVTLFAAPLLGKLSDHVGPEHVLLFGLLFATACFIPMSFVRNIWQFGALRLLVGVSDAALLPAVQAIMTLYIPSKAFGRLFSWNQSFQALGSVSGPMLGAVISSISDYRGVFAMTAIFELINFGLLLHDTHGLRQDKKHHSVTLNSD